VPTYEYDCPGCGPFSQVRPLAEYMLPAVCSRCGTEVERALLALPAMRTRPSAGGRLEASAVSPTAAAHAAGCRCCGPSMRIPRETWAKKLL
jgi:putative FmdB family regulatory protein